MNPALAADIKKLFWDSINEVESKLKITRKKEEHVVARLDKFEIFSQYNGVFIHEVVEFSNSKGSFMIMVVNLDLTILAGTRHIRTKEIEEYEPVLLLNLPDMGHVILKEETLMDKLFDLVTKVDIDFKEYPSFSRNYVLAGDNPDLIRKHFPKPLLEVLSIAKDFYMESHGTLGVLRPRKVITRELIHKLMHIGYRVIS